MPTIVRCPRCGSPASIDKSNEFRPFCSSRCRDVDLHAWATSQYRIAEEQSPDLQSGEPDQESDEDRRGPVPN